MNSANRILCWYSCGDASERIFLDQLRPETGRQKDEPVIDCSAFCDAAVAELFAV